MAKGELPAGRHDGSCFRDSDFCRSSPSELGFRAALVMIKADWAELTSTMGFNNWGHGTNPCLLCDSDADGLYRVAGLSPISFPHTLIGAMEYEARCNACEHWITVSDAERPIVLGRLKYDRRRDGAMGRALEREWGGLRVGDRIEPSTRSSAAADIASLDYAIGPMDVCFWRKSSERGVLHRNPIFDVAGGVQLGISPHIVAVDWLHCLSLGIFKDFCSAVVQKLLHCDKVYSKIENAHVRGILGCEMLQNQLFKWYSSEAKEGRKHCRVQRIEPACFGTYDKPAFSFHGAETNGFLSFILHLLSLYPRILDHTYWLRAADYLCRIKSLIQTHPWKFPPAAIQVLKDVQLASQFSCNPFHPQCGSTAHTTRMLI